jgi:hypothetical protein
MRNVMQLSTGFLPDSHFAYLVRSPLAKGWKGFLPVDAITRLEASLRAPTTAS